MAAFSDTAFSTSAFSVDAFSFDVAPVVTTIIGGAGRPVRRRRRATKEIVEAGLDLTLREMYPAVAEAAPVEAAAIVEPYAGTETVDWAALEADRDAARELIALYVETQERKAREAQEMDDEDEMLIAFEANRFRMN